MHDSRFPVGFHGQIETRPWRLMFIGSTSEDAKGIRDSLQEVYPEWAYNWEPDGMAAITHAINHGLPDIALINANIQGMRPNEMVEWIRLATSTRYIPILIYDAHSDLTNLLDCDVDAVVNDTAIGQRDLIKIAEQMMRRVRLNRLPRSYAKS